MSFVLSGTSGCEEGSEKTVPALENNQIARYGRQLVFPAFGVKGQQALLNVKVLVVGIGGLGSSACLYLASSGIGTLGLLDHDVVATSNLHRQVIHDEASQGLMKVDSAVKRLRELNSTIRYVTHPYAMTPENALSIVHEYDIVVDATDNVGTRYVISDACVIAGKPVVSGAAIGMDGQITVYNRGANSPCYRCRFPSPPKPTNARSCADAGVLGPVPGLIGVCQALEVIKIVAEMGDPLDGRIGIFDMLDARYMVMGLNDRKKDCSVCAHVHSADGKKMKPWTMADTARFLQTHGLSSKEGSPACTIASKDETKFRSISCVNFHKILKAADQRLDKVLLLDVRPKHQYDICSLTNSVNIPIVELKDRMSEIEEHFKRNKETKLFTICRTGILSQDAACLLHNMGYKDVTNISGGLAEWSKQVDPAFPTY